MWAFSDESERGDLMLVAMVTITPGAAIGARRQLRALLLPGQRRVHTAKESPRRRRELLDVVARLDITAVAFSTRRPAGHHRAEIRDRLLNAAAVHAQTVGAMSWILDHQDPAQAQRDRLNITATLGRNAQLVYDHRSSRDEPLLWAADAIAWAIGAGEPWARRVDAVTTVQRLGP